MRQPKTHYVEITKFITKVCKAKGLKDRYLPLRDNTFRYRVREVDFVLYNVALGLGIDRGELYIKYCHDIPAIAKHQFEWMEGVYPERFRLYAEFIYDSLKEQYGEELAKKPAKRL